MTLPLPSQHFDALTTQMHEVVTLYEAADRLIFGPFDEVTAPSIAPGTDSQAPPSGLD